METTELPKETEQETETISEGVSPQDEATPGNEEMSVPESVPESVSTSEVESASLSTDVVPTTTDKFVIRGVETSLAILEARCKRFNTPFNPANYKQYLPRGQVKRASEPMSPEVGLPVFIV